jgi:NTE family protein
VTEYMRLTREQQRFLHDLMALVPEDKRNDPAYRRAGASQRRADQPHPPDLS